MAAVYSQILESMAVVLRNRSGGMRRYTQIKVRPVPVYIKDADSLPLCVVCKPRTEQWEEVDELRFDAAHLLYRVIVCLIDENSADLALLTRQEEAREDARLALWNPTILTPSVSGAFDVEYNPNPAGVDLSHLAPQLAFSLQQFTWKVQATRSDS